MKKVIVLILLFILSCETYHDIYYEPHHIALNKNKITDNKLNNIKLVKTLRVHFDWIYSVSFSSDGKYLASGSRDNTVKIYSTSDWELIKTLENHSWDVNSVSFSSDGKYLVSGSGGNTVKIYSTSDWELVKTLSDHLSNVYSVSFSSDGKYLASGSQDKTVKIYSTSDWKLIKTLKDHSNWVYSVSFSSDGKYFASGSKDNTVKIYDTNNWQKIETLSDHSKDVMSVSFSPDSKYLASGSKDNTVKIYDTNIWQLIETLKEHSNDVEFSFKPSGKYLASGGSDGAIKIYMLPLIKPHELFIKNFVENHINKWQKQKKGEFEKTVDYKKRMSKRDIKAKEFFNEAKEIYKDKTQKYWDIKKNSFINPIVNSDIKILGDYDADRETYKLNIPKIGDVVVNIPIDYAKSFKQNEYKLKLQNPKVVRKGNDYALSSIEIYNPVDNKEFVYNTDVKEDYNPLAEMDFEFQPYNYNFNKIEIESQIIKNKPEKKSKKKQEDKYDIYKNIPKNYIENRDAVAVIIGNKDYGYLNNVDYAINDARLMKKYLMESFGYQEENIIWFENATKGNFETIFGIKGNHKGRLDDYVKKNKSDVFIYYSGHGAPTVDTKKGYFVPVDCDPATVALNGYPVDLLYENLSKIKYKKLTVVVDACFSGENTLENVSPINIVIDNPLLPKGDSFIYTSAKGNQLSTWYPKKQHSLFTYYFLKGIKERGISVTHRELYGYVNNKVSYMSRRLHSREQNPTFNGNKNEYLVR